MTHSLNMRIKWDAKLSCGHIIRGEGRMADATPYPGDEYRCPEHGMVKVVRYVAHSA